MAHKKGVGSTDNGRDSKPKYLGVKLFGGQEALAGNIIVRQRGTKFHPGTNVYMGKDYTLHARVDGTVVFRKQAKGRTYVSIRPSDAETASQTRSILGTREFANEGKATVAPAAAPAVEAPAPKPAKAPKVEAKGDRDDLKKIEGIGPKIEELLNNDGISTFAALADADVDRVQAILDAAGPRYKMHKPATWARQAALARDGQWDELAKLQEELNGGKEV